MGKDKNITNSGVVKNVVKGSLYRRNDSPYWWYEYTDISGKRKQISTRTSRKKVAEEIVRQIQHRLKLADKGGPDSLGRSTDLFFLTRKNAANYTTLKSQLNKYLVTVDNYEAITKAGILYYINNLMSQSKENGSPKYAPSTLRSYLAAISAFCRFLQKRDLLTDNPCSGLRSELPRSHKTPPRFLDEREYDITLKLAKRAGIYLPVFAALKTGMRMSELRYMEWEHLQWRKDGKSLIVIPKDKSKRGRTIPMHADLAVELQLLRKKSGPVFKGAKGGFTGEKQWRGLLAPIQRWVPKFKRSGHKGVGTGWHLFRHTFGYRMAAAGTPIPVLKEIMGHSDISTTMIYARVSPDVWYDEINNA